MFDQKSEISKILNSYQENGYVLVKNLFSQGPLDVLEAQIQLIQDFIKNYDHGNKTFFNRGTRFVFEEQRLHRIVWAQGIAPSFALLEQETQYMEIIAALLFDKHPRNDFQLAQIINQLHIKAPGDGVAFHFHQDAHNRQYNTKNWSDCLGNGSFLQTAIALDPMNETNGTLEFFKGSHKEGLIDLDGDPNVLDKLNGKYQKVSINAEKGDTLFFHPFCVHGSRPNKSAEERKLFINGYCPAQANNFHYPGCGVGKII